jgi:hypothetical protein
MTISLREIVPSPFRSADLKTRSSMTAIFSCAAAEKLATGSAHAEQ